jgi:orotidine-5'-phosphate decarboxylase
LADAPAVDGRPFGSRLRAVFDSVGQLCVGIDPHSYLLKDWNLPDSAAGVREFGLRVVDAAAGVAGIVKPQVAFFERHGSAGFAALEDVFAAARAAGLLLIADAKRGDLGTSVEAYGEAWLTPGSPLEADALTISAYMGVGSINAPMALAEVHGKGLFVLAATSNPEARGIQTARIVDSLANPGTPSLTVAAGIVDDVIDWNNSNAPGADGSIGLVLGATVAFSDYGIDLLGIASTPSTPVLAPGFGHQGARYGDLERLYGAAAPFAVVSASRSILQSGPDGIAAAVASHAREVFECRA